MQLMTTTSKADALAGIRPVLTAYERLCTKVEEMIDASNRCKLAIIIKLRTHELPLVDDVIERYSASDNGWNCELLPNEHGGFSLQLT